MNPSDHHDESSLASSHTSLVSLILSTERGARVICTTTGCRAALAPPAPALLGPACPPTPPKSRTLPLIYSDLRTPSRVSPSSGRNCSLMTGAADHRQGHLVRRRGPGRWDHHLERPCVAMHHTQSISHSDAEDLTSKLPEPTSKERRRDREI